MSAAEDREPGSGLRRTAVELLVRIERGAWPDPLLQAARRRIEDPRDRALLGALVLGVLRWQGALDEKIQRRLDHPLAGLSPVVRAALRVGVCQAAVLGMPWPVAASTAVAAAGNRRARGLVNAVLRRLGREAGLAPLDPRRTLPGWLLERWEARFGPEATAELLSAINRPARPHLVVLEGERAQAAAALEQEGIATRPAALCRSGLEVLSGAFWSSPLLASGRVIVIDESAALVGELARPVGGGPVLDLAAAPGGKAAMLRAAAGGRPLVAAEPVAGRARELSRRLSGPRSAVVRMDGRRPAVPTGRFSLVLLDAPCSGTGTLRRRPDRRWRLRPEEIEGACRLQRELLDAAASLVAPGGCLVYSVCSVEPEEGVAQARRLLAEAANFEEEDPRPMLAAACAPFASPHPWHIDLPPTAGRDGFFAARFRRVR